MKHTVNIKINVINALNGLRANKLRAGLSSLGIIIGVASVVLLLAFGDAAQRSILSQIESLGTNLLSVFPGGGQTNLLGNRGGRSQQDVLDLEMVDFIESSVGGVSGISPEANGKKILIRGQKNSSATIYGVTPSYLFVRNAKLQAGSFISDKHTKNLDKVVVLGTKIVEDLFDGQNPIGQTVRIENQLFTVIGVMTKKDTQGFSDPNSSVFIPLSTALVRVLGSRYLSSIYLSAATKEQIDQLKDDLTQALLKQQDISNPDDANFTILSQQDILKTTEQVTAILKTFLLAIAAISLIVGGIGIMNIMLVSVTERTREIGIRKCIGAHRSDILIQFLSESIMLTLLGGLIGVLISLGITALVRKLGTNAYVSRDALTLALTFSVSVGVVFGLLPAYRAAKLNPIEALRYE